MFITTREACARLGVHPNTLRRWADDGKIPHYRTEAGQRRYDVDAYLRAAQKPTIVCYCRVSSYAQKPELEHQVQFMREQFPNAEIVKDIASGLNNQRQGLKSILERVLRHEKLKIVVARKDRFARFGFELYQWIIEQCGSELMVFDERVQEPQQELVEDLLSIVHVFSCRLHGLRNDQHKANQEAPAKAAKNAAEQMVRNVSLCLQQNGLAAEAERGSTKGRSDQEMTDF
jgi:excisionase family DNA binding protein